MHELKVNVNKNLTSFSIFSARRSTLTSLATWGVKLLCHSVSSILSKCIPSSKITVEILAALKHVELIDSNPEILLYSSTASKVGSHPYNAATSLRFLCHHKNNQSIIFRYFLRSKQSIECFLPWRIESIVLKQQHHHVLEKKHESKKSWSQAQLSYGHDHPQVPQTQSFFSIHWNPFSLCSSRCICVFQIGDCWQNQMLKDNKEKWMKKREKS